MSALKTVILFATALLVSSTAPALLALHKATAWLDDSGNRLPNVRLLDRACRAPFVLAFARSKDWTKPTLLVLGDSQPFNSQMDTVNTWPAQLGESLGMTVINMAVIDAHPADYGYIATALSRAGLHANLAIVNINQSHFSAAQRNIHRLDHASTSWVEFIGCTFRYRRQLIAHDFPTPEEGDFSEDYRMLNLPSDRYILELDHAAETNLGTALDAIDEVAAHTIGIVTPNNVDRFTSYGFDKTQFANDSHTLRNWCQKHLERCIDLSAALSDPSFRDIVHLNTAGNSLLAEKLLPTIGRLLAQGRN